jgi:hypothetical protein
MPRPSHQGRLDDSKYTWRRVQITKLLVMQFWPTSSHLISLGSQYPPRNMFHFPQRYLVSCRIRGSNTGGYEVCCHLGSSALCSVESHSTFQRNKSTPPSDSNNATCFRVVKLLNLFDTEYRGEMLLRNVGRISPNYKALYHRRAMLIYFTNPAFMTASVV